MRSIIFSLMSLASLAQALPSLDKRQFPGFPFGTQGPAPAPQVAAAQQQQLALARLNAIQVSDNVYRVQPVDQSASYSSALIILMPRGQSMNNVAGTIAQLGQGIPGLMSANVNALQDQATQQATQQAPQQASQQVPQQASQVQPVATPVPIPKANPAALNPAVASTPKPAAPAVSVPAVNPVTPLGNTVAPTTSTGNSSGTPITAPNDINTAPAAVLPTGSALSAPVGSSSNVTQPTVSSSAGQNSSTASTAQTSMLAAASSLTPSTTASNTASATPKLVAMAASQGLKPAAGSTSAKGVLARSVEPPHSASDSHGAAESSQHPTEEHAKAVHEVKHKEIEAVAYGRARGSQQISDALAQATRNVAMD